MDDEELARLALKAEKDAAARSRLIKAHLANLRRTFPEPARELALLVFNCMDLLEELSNDEVGRRPASAAELERKEQLLLRLSELLAPNAEEALSSFVEHVVAISRQYRKD